ncbi:hypothetical protein JD844_027448, partial [Phrynosoma platyrhinos]
SIHNGVIAVFQRKGLAEHELYNLNEGVRQLLKTELGSFFTEYLQNQLLTKGMVILRDKIRFYEEKPEKVPLLVDQQRVINCQTSQHRKLILAWIRKYLCKTESEGKDQNSFVQEEEGKEPSVRQLALLHFRNIIALNIKLEDALSRSRARVPPSIIQMLLILQGVHESKGVTEDYLKLEALLQKVVSPYLGTYGLYSSDGPITHSSCILEKRYFRRSKSGDILAKNPVVRSKSYNNPLLTPVAEYETEGAPPNGTGIRRHSVSEMTSCAEVQSYSNLTTITDNGSKSSMVTMKNSQSGESERLSAGSAQCSNHLSAVEQQKGLFYPRDDQSRAYELARDSDLIAIAPTASPENIVDQILESIESDSDGIFIDFSQSCSSSSGYNVDVSRQSIV